MSPDGQPRVTTVIDFQGQVAIVTGAGRGLGRLYALELAARGAAVVVNDVGSSMHGDGDDRSVATSVAQEIVHAGGVAVASHESVGDPDGGRAIIDLAVGEFGRVDAVVSNAGIFSTSPFEELPPADWRRMLQVHLDGAFNVSQPAFRVMRQQRYGRFVFIASSAGLFGQPHSAHYAAAKAGLVGLANVIAIEGAAHGILANVVLPFGMTRMVTETIGEDTHLIDESSFLRAIDPRLVLPLTVFLASRECTFTHHNYSACAGRYARVFVGLADGWLAAPGTDPTADDIGAHLAEMSKPEPYTIPTSIFDEVDGICTRLGITAV